MYDFIYTHGTTARKSRGTPACSPACLVRTIAHDPSSQRFHLLPFLGLQVTREQTRVYLSASPGKSAKASSSVTSSACSPLVTLNEVPRDPRKINPSSRSTIVCRLAYLFLITM